MLEGLVTTLLNRVLGMYVRNFNPEKLSFGIWSGSLTLHDLELRKEALDQLHLPVNVIEGRIGNLSLDIPFTALRSKPIKVRVEDVFLLAAPKEDAEYDVEEEERRAHTIKMEKLESAELLKERNTEGMSKEEQQKQQSFAASLTTAIIDNIQVTIQNIHIRYEDSISDPGHPFAVGLTLQDFSAISTDKNWKQTWIQSTSGSTHKLAKLGALGIYWDTDVELLGPGKDSNGTARRVDTAALFEKMKSMIVKYSDETVAKHQFILKPVTGQAGIEIDKTGKVENAKIKARLLFDELGFVLDDDQYRDALMLIDLFHYFIRHQENRKFRPKLTPKENPREWFIFARNAIQQKIHDRNRKWSWAYFAERRDTRKRYIEIFKKKKKEEKLAAVEASELDKIERKSTYEDLRFWRSLARNQLRKENVGVQKKTPEKQTWSQWIWGSGQSQQQQQEEEEKQTAMTDEDRNKLYEAIDWDEKKALADSVDLPRETVKMQVHLGLNTGSFTLKRDPHGKRTEVLELRFESFNTSFIQRPDSFLARLSLQDMSLRDGTTEGNRYKKIVTVKEASQIADHMKFQGTDEAHDRQAVLNVEEEELNKMLETGFFRMSFEKNPLDGRADSAVKVNLESMEILYNPTFVVETAKFFKPPESHMESIGALMESAGETVEGIRKQTRAGLEFALEEHKTIDAHFDLRAPLLIVPDTVVDECSMCLIIDAGHASVRSDLVSKEDISHVQRKQKQQYEDKDYQELEKLLYDKFTLKLESTQVLIGSSIEATRAQIDIEDNEKDLHIIDRINMDFTIEICIVPRGTEYTKFRVSGNLPRLHASISDTKYKKLMRLLEVAIPHFGEDEPTVSGNALTEASSSVLSKSAKDTQLMRPRSKSFQFSAQEHELVLEDDDDEVQRSEFKDAEQGVQAPGVSIHQRNFEFRFVVEELRGSLYKSNTDPGKPDQLLAELIAQHFHLDFYQRPYDMVAKLGLKTLKLEDHVEKNPSPEFKNIISSEDISSTGKPSEDLFKLKFTKVNPESPEFMSVFGGVATNVEVAVSTLNIFVTRKTLLTLLDFVLVTFASSNEATVENTAPEKSIQNDVGSEASSGADAVNKIRVTANLKKIAFILNNDGIRLATLSLTTATAALTLTGKTMRLNTKLGNLSLVDDVNQGAPSDSPLRQLLTIQGEELADFSYETFDANSDSYPGFDSSLRLRSGHIKVNFVTEPFRKIMNFGVKFGKMQAIFNAARQAAANQATQIQERANRMHFDVLVKTPIVVFPRMAGADIPERDTLTAYLGEIHASNKFMPLDDSENSDIANRFSAGIRNVRLVSLLHYGDDRSEELELIDKVDLGFDIVYAEHRPGYKRPDLEIEGSLSGIGIKLTSQQLKLLLELSKAIPEAFLGDADDSLESEIEHELPDSKVAPAKEIIKADETENVQPQTSKSVAPELGSEADNWTKLDMVFKAGGVVVELFEAHDDEPVGELEAAALSRFALNETNVKLRMMSDGSLESELLIQSFTISDTRKRETNKYRKVMSLINNDITHQFMANVTISGGSSRNLLAILTIDSPRIILSLDYLFAVQKFIGAGFAASETPALDGLSDSDAAFSEAEDQESELSRTVEATEAGQEKHSEAENGMTISFRVNLADAQVILLANPNSTSSEAIVLGMQQAMIAKQQATTLQVEKVGMFLCRMDKFDSSRMRVLDDFSITMSMDVRAHGGESSMTNIHVDVEPLILRLSLRDILLVMQIISKASAMSAKKEAVPPVEEPPRVRELKRPSTKAQTRHKSSAAAHKSAVSAHSVGSELVRSGKDGAPQSAILKQEEMNVHFGGIRVVLIGDSHELPFLDWSVKEFDANLHDWSGPMTADTNIETFINVYNFSKSSWEPFMEPWSLGFHTSRDQGTGKLSVELFSRKMVELSITSTTIALFSKSFQFLSTDQDVLSKPRGTDAPYRLRNQTGFTLSIWTEHSGGNDGSAAKIADREEIPWRFEDAITTRETLSPEGDSGMLGIKLEDSGFDSIDRISVKREGEKLYNLSPKANKITHRILVEVKLGTDNVKVITIRSPLLVENNAEIPIELAVYHPDEGHISKLDPIAPGDSVPAPVGTAFERSLLIRPGEGFESGWSSEALYWEDLMKKPARTLSCRAEGNDSPAPPFYFQVNAVYDKNDPLTRIYPYMRIKVSPPVQVQNLLPFDFKFRIYDKKTKKDWTTFLRKGGTAPVYVVNLSHVLLLSVDLQDTPFKASEFSIIYSASRDYSRDKVLTVKDNENLSLRLKLHYHRIPDSGGAFKVSVYCPYIVLNRTGMALNIKSKAFMSTAQQAAGQRQIAAGTTSGPGRAIPFMFSFGNDDQKNRALIKVGDSKWSKPQSFEAIGSQTEVVVPSADGREEMHLGVTVSQGEGKYNLTHVVTIGPRFVIKNKIGEPIDIREPGSSKVSTLQNGDLHPLRWIRQSTGQQLSLCFPGLNNQWSSAFHISNVGRVHVKLAKDKQPQKLIKVETMLEHATLFIHLSITKHWPFSIRNESDLEVFFFQANPNVDEDEEDNNSGWRPIRYRLPPRSIMPYAWDYPASKNKDLVLSIRDRQRTVKLAEIGQQLPMRLPRQQGEDRQRAIDIDVVADGPTQALVLANWKPSMSLYRVKTGQSMSSSKLDFEVKEQDTQPTFSARLRLAGVGISLINKNLKELLYVTFRDIEAKYNESALYQTISFTTKWIQIDNQLYGGVFPILLYPSVVPKTGKEMDAHPIFHAALTRVKDDSYGVLYIKYFTVLLQQMTFEIDEDFIFALLEFLKIPGASWSEEKEGRLCDEELDIPEPQQQEQGQDVYFELLNLQPMQIDLSFVRAERVNAEDTMAVNSPFMFAVNVMTMSLGNVNDAPLRYNALLIENARVSFGALFNNVQEHYVQESLRQVHIVLGSADFLGNPVGLFNNISSGVADIFYEPYQGLVMTDRPQDLGIGIAKGASSFVKKSVFGFTDSISKITGSMSKGLTAATMDKEYQAQRRMSRARNRPKHALYGVTAGGNAFASSLASGIGGLARHPLEGAEKEGALGFMKGVGKGVLGLATKPAIGAFDLASNLAEGVRNTTTVFDQEGLDRVRLTRFIGSDGIVRPYSQREALGQFWLKTLDSGKFFDENYIAHLELPGEDLLVMLTYNNIMLVRTNKLQTEWVVPLKDIQTISKERTGMNITLKGSRNGPFLPVGDETSRNWLYGQLRIAVTAYNEKWQVRS